MPKSNETRYALHTMRVWSRRALAFKKQFVYLLLVKNKLLKKYNFCFRFRYRGIHLIETNEEVCVFYEKLNIQG